MPRSDRATAHGPSTSQLSDVLADLAVTRARSRRRHPVRARPDGDVRRLPGHRAEGDREPHRRGVAAPDPGQGDLRRPPRVESNLHLASFSQDMRSRGLTPSTRLMRVDEERPPAEVARALRLGARGTAWRVDRVRLADDQPMALEQGWYPVLAAARPRHPGPHRLALHALRRALRPGHRRRRADAVGRGRRGRHGPSPRGARPHPAPRLPARLQRGGTTAGVRRLALPRRPLPAPHDPRSGAPDRRRQARPRHSTQHAATTRRDASRDHHRPRRRAGPRGAQAQPRPAPEVRPQPHAARSRHCPRRRCCSGSASPTSSARTGSAGSGSPRSSAPPVTRSSPTCRCSSPSASRSAWPASPTGPPPWPPSSATSSSRASATRCRPSSSACPRGRRPGAHRLRRPGRHRDGSGVSAGCGSATTGSRCRPTSPSSAVAASCRSSPPWPRS